MKISIMQPYFVPYIGYFQMVNAVDTFVFYDNVTYIKNGWINRNRIKGGNILTIPIKNQSSNILMKYLILSKIYYKTNQVQYLNWLLIV